MSELQMGDRVKTGFNVKIVLSKKKIVRQKFMKLYYRSGMVNSKSFLGKVLLRIKWKFKLN